MKYYASFFALLLFLTGCGTKPQPVIVEAEIIPVMPGAASDAHAINAWLAPYKRHVDSVMNVKIGTASADLLRDLPNAPLNNFVADAMWEFGQKHFGKIDVAVSNFGGLRADLRQGDITIGDIYRVMPFDNMVVVLTLDGHTVSELAQAIARKGGDVTSGITMDIVTTNEGNRAERIRIQGAPINTKRSYRVVTTDYLSFGEDKLEPLGEYMRLENSFVELRTVLIEKVRQMGAVHQIITPTYKQHYIYVKK
ncbi:MAG: 5'-nucleotidase C-terminal domain-containing protein [Prevotellaceae bacterium]|jgi:2',3'-cyclic-nucleotide 2'-phosphodiesterase (5'-nucleotidase family)|nr:5'-nucleotidase C-terminal domain-containing protein [Prevotellaceae bacterium]